MTRNILKNFFVITTLLFCMIMSLSACDNGDKPKNSLISEDLAREITNHKDFLIVDDFEITQSLSQGDTFTATINVMGMSQYAEFDLTADVVYTNYDQGWAMDSCNWTENGHNVVSYPTTEEVAEISETVDDVNYQFVNMTTDGDTITYTCMINAEIGDSFTTSGKVDVYCQYDSEEDSWERDYSTQSELSASILNNSIEGSWESVMYTDIVDDSVIKISNITEKGFEISGNLKFDENGRLTGEVYENISVVFDEDESKITSPSYKATIQDGVEVRLIFNFIQSEKDGNYISLYYVTHDGIGSLAGALYEFRLSE